MMLVFLSFIPLILSCLDLIVQLIHLPLSDHLILLLIQLRYMLLVFFYLFLQGSQYALLFFHLISDAPPLSHYIFLLSLQRLDLSIIDKGLHLVFFVFVLSCSLQFPYFLLQLLDHFFVGLKSIEVQDHTIFISFIFCQRGLELLLDLLKLSVFSFKFSVSFTAHADLLAHLTHLATGLDLFLFVLFDLVDPSIQFLQLWTVIQGCLQGEAFLFFQRIIISQRFIAYSQLFDSLLIFKCLCFQTFLVLYPLSLHLSRLVQDFFIFAFHLTLQSLDLSLQFQAAPFSIIHLFLILPLVIINLRPHLRYLLLQHQLNLRTPLHNLLPQLIAIHDLTLKFPHNAIQILKFNLLQFQFQLVLVISVEVLLLD